jgi:hypothetical protein
MVSLCLTIIAKINDKIKIVRLNKDIIIVKNIKGNWRWLGREKA